MIRNVMGDKKASAPRSQGAIQSKTSLRDRADSWLAHHSTSAIESLLRLLQTPLQSLMTWLVVAVAVALPGALFIALINLQQIGQQWQDSSEMSAFLQQDAQDEAIETLRKRLSTHADIGQLTYISPAEALLEFRQHSGLGRIVDSLDSNPLPAVFLIQPSLQANNPASLEALQAELSSEPLIAEVRIDMQWVKRLQQLMAIAERIVLALASLLALGLILIIGNTIRLAIENRREEILVVKLVGGTNAWVRRPFLYTGLWYGLGGGIIAAVILTLGLAWLANPVGHLVDLYQSSFRLQGLGFIGSLQLVLLAGFMGLLGAWVAVGRHLSQIEPH